MVEKQLAINLTLKNAWELLYATITKLGAELNKKIIFRSQLT